MYAADIDSERHTFQASGSLWQDALVMQDLESQSLWSQVSGTCIKGPLEGKTLTLYRSIHTTFREFQALYPQGLVLAKPERGDAGSAYTGYMSDPNKLGIFGRTDNFERVPAKSLVYGLRLHGEEYAVTRERLQAKGFALIDAGPDRVLVSYDTTSGTAAAYVIDNAESENPKTIRISGTRLSFAGNDQSWDTRTGQIVSGTGASLPPVPLITSYWFAWASFFPDSKLIR